MTDSMDAYERDALAEIEAWKAREPDVISRAAGRITKPLEAAVEAVIPEAALEAALHGANWTAGKLEGWGRDKIMTDGQVNSIEGLRGKSLPLSDELANTVHNYAISAATLEGGITGVTGLAGLAADIPAVVVLSLMTIRHVGLCYGFDTVTEEDQRFALGVLSAASSNSMAQKRSSLLFLRSMEVILAKETWKSISRKAAEEGLKQYVILAGVKQLAKQLGVNLTKRKALQVVPVIGAGIGAAVNASYIRDVGYAARRMYQERWLIHTHGEAGAVTVTMDPVPANAAAEPVES